MTPGDRDRISEERQMTKTAVIELAISQLVEQRAPRPDPEKIQEAIESLRAMKSGARKAGA